MVTIDSQTRIRKGFFFFWIIQRTICAFFFVGFQCEPNQSNEIPLPSGPVLQSGVLQSSFETLTFENIRIGHLFVDHFQNMTIIFVITLDGLSLRKYSLVNNQLCLIEHIQLKPTNISDEQWKINRVEFLSETVRNIHKRRRRCSNEILCFCFRKKLF